MVTDRDVGYQRIFRSIMGAPTVRVTAGIRSSAGGDVLRYAAINEFGSSDGHVPERSFLRSTLFKQQEKYRKRLAKAGQAVILDGEDIEVAFGRVGIELVADVQRTIRDHVPPPNAPSTIRKKGSSTPLIDTGRMRQSIDYVVEAT